ncbi:MAG: hypothetical protein IT456_28280 [Planctomycetes bacterium]|nr:hypothetical protein [Planctomycetota bacterium]
MRPTLRHYALVLLSAVSTAATMAVAQTPTFPHLVLAAHPSGNPAAEILEVDTAAGMFASLGRFPADVLPPLAITMDPFDRHLLVALNLGTNLSRIVRLERTPTGLIQYAMCDVPGAVSSMHVNGESLVVASDGGQGVWNAPRRGGNASLALAQDNLTAMHGYGANSAPILIAWTGRPGTGATTSGTAVVDSATGQFYLGPDTFLNPTGLLLTGAVDLPTGVPRQLLAFADGSFSLFTPATGAPQVVNTSIAVPPGGAVAMLPGPLAGFPTVLGGTALPRLYSIDPFSGAVTFLSPPLPGSPIDFCSGGASGAQGLQFSNRCGPMTLFQGWTGLEQPGSTFAITVQGQPNGYAVITIGLRDTPALPVGLPGGCHLDVSPDAVVFRLLDALGNGAQPIPVPAGQGLLGLILYSQWLHADSAGISVSGAVAHQIGL